MGSLTPDQRTVVPVEGGDLPVQVFLPPGGTGPGLVVCQEIFGVTVDSVNTANRKGKRKRTRTGFGHRKSTKRAIVTIADGERIDIFAGPAS